jgi:YegS/Rv2252/BmrU family lipid kinase
MGRRALLLVNRSARHGERLLGEAIAELRRSGLELVEQSAAHPRRLSDVIRRYRDRVDLVVVGGGDGTLNGAADGLVEAQLPLGILPMGTANDLARTLGLPADLSSACRVIAEGRERRIDLGRVNDKHYFNVASIGLSTAIARRLTRQAKSRWGVLAYGVTALRVLWESRPFHAEIRTESETIRVKTIQVAVGNGRYYGGGMTIAADAAIDDHRLELYSIEVRRWWQVLPLLPALRHGDLEPLKEVRNLSGQVFEVRTHRPRPVNTDGELTTHTPAQFHVVPKALAVLVPGPALPARPFSAAR